MRLALPILCAMIQVAYAKPVTYIHAKRIDHDPTKGTLTLTTLQLRYPYQQHHWLITANHATLKPSGDMHLEGTVTLAQGTDHLHTTEMDLDPVHHLIHGEHTIQGQLHQNTIQAPTFLLTFPHGELTFPHGLSITHALPKETLKRIENLGT